MRLLLWFIADRVDMIARPNFRKHELLKWGIFFILLAVLGFLYVASSNAQVTVALSPVAKQQFFSTTGVPLASGCVNTYITGTSTPLATYVDGTGASQNANPIILDGGGFANIWLTNASYRFVVVAYDGIPGNKCAAGITQYTVDAINAYAPISTGANLFLLGQASDPAGTGGELIYRNDIPCIRAFTTLWDCLVRLTDTQTLTNKTLTTPTITTPTITGTISGTPTVATWTAIANDPITGTSTSHLAKLNNAASAGAILPLITDTGGIIGICVTNCAVGGTGTIQQSGTASCVFDGGTTSGDYVTISPATAGDCRDAGSTFPASGSQVVGRVLSTNGSPGTYSITLFGPEFRPIPTPAVSPTEIYSTASASVNASIGATSMLVTIGTPSTLRFGAYLTQTVLGASCAGNTTIVLNIIFKDPNAAVAQTIPIATFTVTTNGTLGIIPMTTNTQFPIYARTAASQTTSYSTTYTAGGSCSPAPSYQVFPMLEQF